MIIEGAKVIDQGANLAVEAAEKGSTCRSRPHKASVPGDLAASIPRYMSNPRLKEKGRPTCIGRPALIDFNGFR